MTNEYPSSSKNKNQSKKKLYYMVIAMNRVTQRKIIQTVFFDSFYY